MKRSTKIFLAIVIAAVAALEAEAWFQLVRDNRELARMVADCKPCTCSVGR